VVVSESHGGERGEEVVSQQNNSLDQVPALDIKIINEEFLLGVSKIFFLELAENKPTHAQEVTASNEDYDELDDPKQV
jgi:hypothetical protein